MFKSIIPIIVMLMLPACTIYHHENQDDPKWSPSYPIDESFEKKSSGSIYNVATAKMLFQDKKALRVGDIVTVLLTENTNATKTADTEINKDTAIKVTPPKLFGRFPNFGSNRPNFGIDITTENAFKAAADTQQSNLLQGTISVTVQKVYANGNLLIRGEKWISLNQGSEFIRVSGMIRPQDISKDNQIDSTRIANARLYYGGRGVLAEANEEGWLSRFFNSGWWPF